MSTISRAGAIVQLQDLSRMVCQSIAEGNKEAVDLLMTTPSRPGDEVEATPVTACGGGAALTRLTQLWVVIGVLHGIVVKGKKLTQRELWYRIKPTGLFASPEEVSRRVLDVCAVLSERCGGRCPREALGVIASPRGFMTGAVSLLLPDSEQLLPLDSVVYPIPGDPEECDALVFASSLARCVLVVEKESVFRRLVDDGFTRRLPCLLLTACGFPDYASRAALRRATDALDLPVFVLTDYNPHGMALMLVYKHGSTHAGLDGYACPELCWLGLVASDVLAPMPRSLFSGSRADAERTLPPEDFQPFTPRDRSVLEGLRQRSAVRKDATLAHEVERMHEAQLKVELEALAGFGDDFLADFLLDKIVVRKGIATHEHEHEHGAEHFAQVGGELSLRHGF